MFNDARRRHDGRERQLGDLQHRRRPADAVQVRRQLRGSDARLPARAASTSSRSRRRRPTPGTCCSTTGSRPRRSSSSSNIGTAFRFNEETRPTDAYDGDQTTTSGYGMVDIAFAARTRLVAGARVERFDQTVTTQDPFGLFATRSPGARTRTPTCSRRSTSCRASAPTRTSASATARRSTGPSSASWPSSSSPTSSATAR